MIGRRSFRFATGSPSGNREVLHVTRLIRILLAGLAVLVALELAPAAAGPVPAADADLHVLGAATTTTTTTVPTSPGFFATLSGTYDCSTGEITLTLKANRRSIPVALGTVTVVDTVAIVNGLLVPLSPGFAPVALDPDFSTSGVVTAVDANPNVIVVRFPRGRHATVRRFGSRSPIRRALRFRSTIRRASRRPPQPRRRRCRPFPASSAS